MNIVRTICMVVGGWLLTAIALYTLWFALRELHLRLRCRCALCRTPSAIRYHSRFGQVCSECYDALWAMYHRPPRSSGHWEYFDGDGWRNG